MRFASKYMLVASGALLVALLGKANAQHNLPPGPANYEHDLQLFAPLELDIDNLPPDDYAGYFFEYNKLFWSYTGERVTVGDPDIVEFAEIIYYDNASDEGDPPPPHQITNTLNDVPPKAGFAMGNRYELGYRDRDNGWLISVLDGPELNQTEFYGFQPRETDGGIPPFIDDDYTDGTDIGPGNGPIADGDFRAFGFGSVPVLFETPPGYLYGFRDYLNFLVGAQIGTQGGPYLYVGNYGGSTETDDADFDFFRLTDDLDEDLIPGAAIIVDEDDNIIAIVTDFDDLHRFNIFFDNVTVHNATETNGVELMWSHRLTNRHWQAKHQNNYLQMYYGVRYLELYDQFDVTANGSILGRSTWNTSFTNQIVGPQVAMKWVNQRQRWRLQADARFMFGYNTADWDQTGLMGENLIPGAVNRLLYARPTAFSHGLQEQEFAPVGELRFQASYQVTKSFAIKAGYTGMYMGGIKRAATSVRYRLPDMGYANSGTQDFLSNGLDLGIEFCH